MKKYTIYYGFGTAILYTPLCGAKMGRGLTRFVDVRAAMFHGII